MNFAQTTELQATRLRALHESAKAMNTPQGGYHTGIDGWVRIFLAAGKLPIHAGKLAEKAYRRMHGSEPDNALEAGLAEWHAYRDSRNKQLLLEAESYGPIKGMTT